MEFDNKNIIWYVVGALVLVLIIALVWGSMKKPVNNDASPTVNINNQVDNNNNSNDGGSVDTNEEDSNEQDEAQASADEAERLEGIQSERERLLAEQAALEASAGGEEGDAAEVSAERQQEIELELLELQNQEEYPPLPDPGV